MHDRRFVDGRALLPLLLLCIALVSPSLCGDLGAQETSPVAGGCNEVSIPLTATSEGNFAPLKSEHLEAWVDGQSAAILDVRPPAHPPRIIVMVQTSGSIDHAPKVGSWAKVATWMQQLAVYAIPVNSSAALLTFATSAKLGSFTTVGRITDQVQDLREQKPEGKAAIFDALVQAPSLLGTVEFGDTIFLVSNGADTQSGANRERAISALVARGIRVFSFVVDNGPDHPPETKELYLGPEVMGEIAKDTGGTPVRYDWQGQIDYREIGRVLQLQAAAVQELRVKLKAPLSKESSLKIRLSAAGRKLRHVTLTFPKYAEPCTGTP